MRSNECDRVFRGCLAGVVAGLMTGLASRGESLNQLLQGLQSLAASDNVSGAGADGMRAYIGEVHMPIIQTLLASLTTFQTAIGVYWAGYSEVDSDPNFRLVKDELDTHATQLESGMGMLRDVSTQLRSITSDASHLVSLGGAGANEADQAVDGLQQMQSIAKQQHETWESYEATDPGFAQVQNLISDVRSIVTNVGNLTMGQGHSYTPGSFDLTLQQLGELVTGVMDYSAANQTDAATGWDSMFTGYTEDFNAAQAAALKAAKEKAGWDLVVDALQVTAGVLIIAIGVVGTPFTGGVTLGLAVLGASLVAGGVNGAINHASIATTGEELNLIGNASTAVGQWYDVNVSKPAAASGSWDLQFLAGVGSGAGQIFSDAAQTNLVDISTGIQAFAADPAAGWSAIWGQLTTTAAQVAAGDAFAIGELTAEVASVLIPGAAALKAARLEALLGKADKLTGLVTPPKITAPGTGTSGPIGGIVGGVANTLAAREAAKEVERLAAKNAKDLEDAIANLNNVNGDAGITLYNEEMVASVRGAIDAGRPLTLAEQNFIDHELLEASYMRQGMSQDDAHRKVFETIPPGANYSPEILLKYSEWFSPANFKYWGIEKPWK